MALIPGLTTFSEDLPEKGLSIPARAVPNDRGPAMPRLQPVSAPVETYFHVQNAEKDNELIRLASGLAALNPALNEYASAVVREDHADLAGKVAQTIGGKTGQDAHAALSANPELQSKAAQRLGHAQLGMGVAENTANEIANDYSTGKFDRDGGDLDKFIGGYIERDLKSYGSTDPNFAATYRERIMARVGALRHDLTTYRAGQANQAQDQQVTNALLGTANAAMDRAEDPRVTYENIRGQLQANKLLANKPIPEQEKLLVDMLGRLSGEIERNPQRADAIRGLIRTIAETPRVDPTTKQDLGALKDSTTVGGKVADILRGTEHAYNKQDQNNNWKSITDLYTMAKEGDPNLPKALDATIAAKPQWMDQNERTRLIEMHRAAVAHKQAQLEAERLKQAEEAQTNATTSQALAAGVRGDLHTVRDAEIIDAKGNPKVVTRDEQIKAATEQRMRQIDQDAAAGRVDPFQAKVKWFTDNPEAPNDEWQKLLRAGPAGATTATMANGKIVSKAAEQGYDLYKKLSAAAPNLAYKYADDRARQFYERAKAAEEVQGLPPQEAVALSARAMSDPNEHQTVASISPSEFNKKAEKALSSFWRTGVTDTANHTEVYGRLRMAAENLVRGNHLSWDDAIAQASKGIEKQYTVVNGVSVLTADKNVPPNFGRVANKFFNSWYEAHKEELDTNHISRSDLSMQNINGTPNWKVVLKGTLGDPGVDDPGISLNDLYGTVKMLEEQEKIRGQRKLDAAGKAKAISVYDAVQDLEPQVSKGVAIILDPFEHKYVSLAKARANLDALKQSPDYAKGAEHRRQDSLVKPPKGAELPQVDAFGTPTGR